MRRSYIYCATNATSATVTTSRVPELHRAIISERWKQAIDSRLLMGIVASLIVHESSFIVRRTGHGSGNYVADTFMDAKGGHPPALLSSFFKPVDLWMQC